LFVRCTSPHEIGESLAEFFRKLDRAMERAWNTFRRINIACAVQPQAVGPTPDLVTICRQFQAQFLPERIRVVQIDPRQDGQPGALLTLLEVDQLRSIDVEILTVDGRRPLRPRAYPNGLLLADFFDFT